MKKKELMDFIESLSNRGLLTKPIDQFDYEWVIWDYLKSNNSLLKEETRSVAHNKQTEKSCHVDIKAGIDCSGMCLINHCKWFY